MEEIKDIIEILELLKEDIENNNENASAILDLQDLKSLSNLYNAYKVQNKQLNDAFSRGWVHKDTLKEILDKYRRTSVDDSYTIVKFFKELEELTK